MQSYRKPDHRPDQGYRRPDQGPDRAGPTDQAYRKPDQDCRKDDLRLPPHTFRS